MLPRTVGGHPQNMLFSTFFDTLATPLTADISSGWVRQTLTSLELIPWVRPQAPYMVHALIPWVHPEPATPQALHMGMAAGSLLLRRSHIYVKKSSEKIRVPMAARTYKFQDSFFRQANDMAPT